MSEHYRDVPNRAWTTEVFPSFSPTVPNLIADGAARFGGRDCLATPAGGLSYEELDRRSGRLAAQLVRLGAGKGSRVAILFPNGPDWLISWAAVARIGAIVVPVNTFYKPEEFQNFLRYADVQYLLGVGSFLRHDYLQPVLAAVPEVEGARPPLYLPSFPHLRRVMIWGGPQRSWTDSWGADDALDDDDALLEVVRGLEAAVTPGDELTVIFTSGSTSDPKGVVHTHGSLIRHGRNLAALSGLDETARLWSPMPLCWVGGLVWNLLRALTVGGCFVTQDVFDGKTALMLIERERVTHVSGWPHTNKSLMEHPDYAHTDLSALRSGLSDALPPDRKPADPGLTPNALGMSETGGPHTFWLPGEEASGVPERYRGSYGHQVPGMRHRIIDPETGHDVPDGTEGEVLVRGYSLMKGLYKRENSAVFDDDGWYHTGDRGVFRDGWFFFTGRQNDMIKTRGSNVAPAEVEVQLLRIPGVKLAVVVGVPHPVDGEEVVALILPHPRAMLPDEDHIKNHLRKSVSSYKVPRHVFVLADQEIPWLTSQKVDRRALLARAGTLVRSRVNSVS